MKRFLLFLLAGLGGGLAAHSQTVYYPGTQGTLYVDSASSVNGADYNWIGDSWPKAIPSLADALRAADSLNTATPGTVKQIWVAGGTYQPSYSIAYGHHKEDGGRNNAFLLLKEVKVYGGFSGTEDSPDDRDTAGLFTDNRTVLSGDLGGGQNGNDQAYHVVVAVGNLGQVELNGFVVSGGSATGTSQIVVNGDGDKVDASGGGGVYALKASALTIANCIIAHNNSAANGGGIRSDYSDLHIITSRFSDNKAEKGGAVFLEEVTAVNPEIVQTVFIRNIASEDGGGVFVTSASPAFVSCSFLDNRARKGGGMYDTGPQLVVGGSEVVNSIFSGNQAEDWGGGVYANNSFGYFTNCLFSGNKANYGGAFNIDNGSETGIFNCTIVDNEATASNGGASIRVYQSSPTIRNSIIWGNNSIIAYSGAGQDIIQYSLVQSGQVAGTAGHNLSTDPLFVDPSAGNYQLKTNSPVLDKGTSQLPDQVSLPAADLAGNARVLGIRPDMGAYEIQGYAPDKNGILYVNKNVSGGDRSGDSWKNAFKELSDALLSADQVNKARPGAVKEIWVAKGTYSPLYSAKDGHRTEDGDKLNSFVLLEGVKLYGGFAGTETSPAQRDTADLFSGRRTTLDGQNTSYHVVIAANIDSAVLDGFVITGGEATGAGFITVNQNINIAGYTGGGMECVNATVSVSHCNFIDNRAYILIDNGNSSHSDGGVGGGLFNYLGSVSITSCTFQENEANFVGGALSSRAGTAVVTACNFIENIISASYTDPNSPGGGAIYFKDADDASKVINSLFSKNKINLWGKGAGIYNDGSSPQIENCIFENNETPVKRDDNTGGGIYNEASSPRIAYCSFNNNIAGYGGGIFNDNSSPDIYNCTFNGNEANYKNPDDITQAVGNGGAVYNSHSSPHIINSSFLNNLAYSQGAAIKNYSKSSPVIAGCLFVNNRVTNPGMFLIGGVIYNELNSNAAIINSTLIAVLNTGAAVFNIDASSSDIVNTIIWGTVTPLGAVDDGSEFKVSYSLIQQPGGQVYDGNGNLNKDPLFVDPAKGRYTLRGNSPAIAAGNNNMAQYHLPDADLAGNPRVADGKINIGAYASAFVHPTALTATYDGKDTVNVSWEAFLQGDESYVGGDNFKLERSADSTFEGNVKTVTSGIKYEPDRKTYKIQDDITDVSGGLILYYRLTRTMEQNQDWQQPVYDTAGITILTRLEGTGTDTLIAEDGSIRGDIRWEPFAGVWTQGTQFNLIKKNKTDGTQQTISIDEEVARAGRYVDDNIPTCKEIRYTLSVKLGNHYASPPDADIPDSILTEKLEPISDLTASRGYYPDRTSLRWSTAGSYDRYVINRRVYGSPDTYEQIAALDGKGLLDLHADDDKGTPGVYYQYLVTGLTQCSNITLHSDTLTSIGFRSPTGTVYGRVTYDNGGGAVQGASVRMESTDNTKLGKSIYLDGQHGSTLRLDSLTSPLNDSSFTISVWIRPEDDQPESQIIFAREGQYTLGFDDGKQLYFAYNGSTVTAPYIKDKVNGWAHVSATHKKDSLVLMLHVNDTVIARHKMIAFQPANYASRPIFIGSNSDGANFKGNIDELRLWNISRDSAEIAADYSRLLTGGEKGLAAYWRFDATISDQFYDISHDGEKYNRNDGTMDPLHVKRSDLVPAVAQLSLKAYTDSTGNYTITGIPYTGVNGTTYAVAPLLGSHNFDPVTVTRIFSPGSSTFTLDFKDKSSYIVSGIVFYDRTNVPVQGVQFKVDGTYAFTGDGSVAQTNDKGEFSISVPVGVHTVQAVKLNHGFAGDGKILDVSGKDVNYQQNLAAVMIRDTTKIRFIGRVAGGAIETDYPLGFSLSKNILGAQIAITLKAKGDRFLNFDMSDPGRALPPVTQYERHILYPEGGSVPVKLPDSTKIVYEKDRVIIYPDTATGEFEADLIPADFLLTAVEVGNGALSLLQNQAELDLSDSLIEKTTSHTFTDSVFHADNNTWSYSSHADTVKYNASYILSYRTDPVITVEQTLNPGNPQTTGYFGNLTYTYSPLGGDNATIPLYDEKTGKYTFHHPAFRQNVQYGFKITASEPYPYYEVNGDIRDTSYIPSQEGTVNITNTLKDNSSPDTVHLNGDGVGYYTFLAGEPELADGIGLKGFAVNVQIGSRVYPWNKGNTYEAYVFGGRPVGQDFTTVGPDDLIGILRDPPGSNSYSFIQKGSSVSVTRSFSNFKSTNGSLAADISAAPVIKTLNGIGVAVATEINTVLETTISATEETHWQNDSTFVATTTFEDGYQTSGDPSFDGEADDVFIGRSSDITYGATLALLPVPAADVQSSDSIFFRDAASGYYIVQRTGLHAGEQFKTLFAYPQYFIETNLIPNLIKIRNAILSEGSALADPQKVANENNRAFYVSKIDPANVAQYGAANNDETVFGNQASDVVGEGPSYTIYFPQDGNGDITVPTGDTIMVLDQSINRWQHWLRENEKAKVTADYDENYSFGAGATIDHSTEVSTDTSANTSFSWVVTGGLSFTKGVKINKVGILVTASLDAGGGEDSSRLEAHNHSHTVGFHLEEGGSNYMTIDVGKDLQNFYVFRTKGGVTACPYEGATVTRYYNPGTALNQPTVQREMPKISVDKPVVTGVAANRAASYTLHLWNESSVKGDIYFGLNVIDKSNPYGAKIYLDGTALGNGRDILIPAGETLTKTLTVEKGPDSMNYDNLQIILHSTCQYNPVVYNYNIADTTTISARFLPACSDIHLSSPSDQWLINTLSPEIVKGTDTVPYLPVVLDQYDLNKNLFDHIDLQYKAATGPDWVTAARFFTDSAHYNSDQQGGTKEVITSPDKTNYNLLMNSDFADGLYDIRAVSVCVDNGRIVAQTPSNTATGSKDTYKPRPFGNPQPANGILGIGQSASVKFNEPIDIGYLNQQAPYTFFSVRGIKNGSALDSTVSVQLDGQNDYAVTEFDKNMAGKDFTVAMWFMPDKTGGTLFSQGNKNDAAELALTADGHIRAVMGNQAFASSGVVDVPTGQWSHIALVYRRQDSTVQVFYNYQNVLTGTGVHAFKGTGPLLFGRSLKEEGDFFAGKMRDLRVWTTALTSIKLQQYSTETLSGGESHLLACYPMEEGKGQILHDKAHGNHAAFTGGWKMPEGRSVALNGDGYVRLNTSQAVIAPDMDFTLGLWFRGEPGQINATLISSGKGDGADPGGSGNLFSLGFENGNLTFTNNSYPVRIEGDYLDNDWHQVVIAANRNTGNAQCYVDGQLKKFFDAGNLGGLAATFTYLGVRAYRQGPDGAVTQFDRYFKGEIDEVRIWNTYLNSTLVTGDGNTRLTGKETGLLAYYPFERQLKSSSGVWSTTFSTADQKVQQDPDNHVPDPVLHQAAESREKAPVKDPGPTQDLGYDFVANGDAVLFNFNGGASEMKAIDKTIVTFTATNIRDMHGNYMASPVTWTAYINQNPLSWSEETLSLAKDLNAPMQFESYIVNSGGSEESFTLNNLPPWLTADVTAGTVQPEGRQKITFTVNQGLNTGAYDAIVEMNNSLQETQGLALNLKVIGQVPDWKINPEDFQYSMAVYGRIRVNGIFSSNPDDMLAAFHDGKCVGVVHNSYFQDGDLWYAFLTVYSNEVQMDGLEFRIWDAGNGKVYVGVPDEGVIDFENGNIVGTPRAPVTFDGKELVFQDIPLLKGWNWISFNVQGENFNNVNATLGNGRWQSGDIIKLNNTGFASYSGREASWITGSLQSFGNQSSYMLKTSQAQALSVGGTAVNLKETPIPVGGGQWNYISFLPQDNMTVKEALAGYLAMDGDVIKSQTGFAMYDDRMGWVGNLQYMEPGKGYMLYRTGASDTAFYYPVLSGILRQQAGAPLAGLRLNPYELPVSGNFSYAENMTVLAAVAKGFTLMQGDKILAYSGANLCGQALALQDRFTGRSLFFFNIAGVENQPVHFEVERRGKSIARTEPVAAYQPDRVLGSLHEPFLLHFGVSSPGARIFPNPFRDRVTLRIALIPGTHEVQNAIYDAKGRRVRQDEKERITGKSYEMVWDGSDEHGMPCSAGIYFIHVLVDGRPHIYKVVKQ